MADTWVTAIAEHLHAVGIVDYQPLSAGGDLAIAHLPNNPDEIVSLWPEGGGDPLAGIPVRWPRLQARVRGEARGDRMVPYVRASLVLEALHDLRALPFTGGLIKVVDARQSSPQSIGTDEEGRPEWVVNFGLHVTLPT